MSKWKMVSQKSILKKELFEVKQLSLKDQKGKLKKQFITERNPTVCVFPITKKYEVYLIKQFRPMHGKIVLEAVSGYIEKKESSLAAAKRELKEETGISADQLEEFARIEIAGSVLKSRSHLFLATGLEEGEKNLQDDEEIEVVKMSLSNAAEKVLTGEINHSSSVIGVLMLEKLKREKKIAV
jgi:ADP-ribose pyrophosphatase